MLKLKKLVVFSLAFIMLVSLFSGCGMSGNKDVASVNSSTAAVTNTVQPEQKYDFSKKVTIKIVNGAHYELPPAGVDPNNNQFVNLLKDAANVDVQWNIIPADQYEQKKSVLMGSGDLPDMIFASQLDIVNWVGQDLLTPLDDVIKNLSPNLLTQYIPPYVASFAKLQGKQYGIPLWYEGSGSPNTIALRNDWLKNLNLEIPTTTEELYNVLKQFTFGDPDKNGKNDTYGIGTTKDLAYLDPIFAAFGVHPYTSNPNFPNSLYWTKVNGKLVPDYIRPEMKDALQFIRRLYQDKILFNESIVQDDTKYAENVTGGKYGCASLSGYGLSQGPNTALSKKNPNSYFIPIVPPKGPKGNQGFAYVAGNEGFWVVTQACKYPERLIKMFDWTYSGGQYNTGADQIFCGTKKEYMIKMPNGMYKTKGADQMTAAQKTTGYRCNYLLAWDDTTSLFPPEDFIKYGEYLADQGEYHKTYPDTMKIYDQYAIKNPKVITGPVEADTIPELNKHWQEYEVGIITGKQPLEAFDQWVSYFNNNGGDKIIAEANKLAGN